MYVGKSVNRIDAVDKVTGRAKYTQDYHMPGILTAKVVRSNIANGKVVSFDLSEAEKVPGVVAIFTCFDVPKHEFPTAGHPWSVDPKHQDISDRRLLNERVRYYGDDIAVVVAKDNVSADRARRLIKVEYEEYEPILNVEDAMKEGATPLHPEVRENNIIVRSQFKIGEDNFADLKDKGYNYVEGKYSTQVVQHCHIELPVSRGYLEANKIVLVSSTQIPHITRRVCAQALGCGIGDIRIIKPYIGGGFGNKQDVLYEPLNAWLVKMLEQPVEIFINREETFSSTRTRHAIDINLKTYVSNEGRLIGRWYEGFAENGGYASHGHAICANCANEYRMMYQDEKVLESTSYTVYTNKPAAGAMRGYGIPQACFAMESHMDDIALSIGMDPVEFRKKNMMKEGYVDPLTTITCYSSKLEELLEEGKKYIDWDNKRKTLGKDTGVKRRGVGMALFCYKTGVYPISLETATVRMILNQDGSVQVQMGATEIGQGAGTVFAQMAADTLGLSIEKIHMMQTQDTDTTPFDTGAYASRQTYVSGMALKKSAEVLKEKILSRYKKLTNTDGDFDIKDDMIVNGNEVLMSVEELAMNATYGLDDSEHITSNETHHCTTNTYSFGVTFTEIEVDTKTGKIEILDIINLHDSGKIINPKVAMGQVHGGMSMGLGYALGEEYKYDNKGKLLNGNLLDYKMPTAMDHPDLHGKFIESFDESGPYGNKSLGEPPTIAIAPAIRNAFLHATGVAINSIPLNPQKVLEELGKGGL